MKAVILAGGQGSRLSEETDLKPKPMVEIGGRPILWHVMKILSQHAITEFVICLGYRGYVIKEYFANYFLHMADVTFDLARNAMEVHQAQSEPWRVTLVDTGVDTMTGGRIKRVLPFVRGETFLLTYGDGVGDIDVTALLAFHRSHGGAATITAARPPGRFGTIHVEPNALVSSFHEKVDGDAAWINGGFFVLEPSIGEVIAGDDSVWEAAPLEQLAADGELYAYRHGGFWLPMDTLRDRRELEHLWETGRAPWKTWE